MSEKDNLGSTKPDEQPDKPLVRRMLNLVLAYRGRCVWVIILHLLLLILGLLGLSAAGMGVDIIRHRDNLSLVPIPFGLRPPESWTPMRLLCVMGGTILVVSLIRLGLFYYTKMTAARVVQDMMIRLRSDIYEKLQRLGFRFYDSHMSGGIINRVTSDVQLVRMFMDEVVLEGIILVLTLGISLAYMLSIHPGLTAACLATTPVLAISTYFFTRKVKPAMRRTRELYDHLILVLAENVQGIHVVKGFVREPQEVAKFDASNRKILEQQRWLFRISSFYNSSSGFLTYINMTVLIGFGGYLVMTDRLPLGSGMIVFYGLLGQFSNQVANLAAIANRLQMSFTGARRVFEVLDMPVEIKDAPKPVRLSRTRGSVEFENVTFGYDSGKPVLIDINLKVEPGQVVAIVGPTGAGKSTLLSLIPRFYEPQHGRVLIDGVDVRDLRLDDLRRNIGFVFQETFLFSNTVSANIAFGSPDSSPERVAQAARVAAAHNFVIELQKEYETIIGERGVGLSGGQRQRIALARAILLEPGILLLDDPTAAIDPQTESEIQVALSNVMSGRTTFIVSHRLSTLRRADSIVVIEKGRIAQVGTHEQLMNMPGHYRDMANIQFNILRRRVIQARPKHLPEETPQHAAWSTGHDENTQTQLNAHTTE
ncbi:MAG: ABC transporter ATP-binding protein [Verrucomicrobia bacterium]|nr:ABC transporter ATP-binding protein [Verrucomicrobiota bacterium]